jgi:hypothetical protein
MSNLAFGNQNPEKIAPVVEEQLRKELGTTTPVPYEIEPGEGLQTTLGTALGEVLGTLVGGKEHLLFTIHFHLPGTRLAELRVHLNRQGIGAHAGALLYTSQLARPMSGEVTLEAPKTFGSSKFVGAPTVCARLNTHGDLLKRLGKLARTESQSGGITLKMPRICKIVPHDAGALFILNTLARPTGMGFGANMDAKEFLELAALLEAAL